MNDIEKRLYPSNAILENLDALFDAPVENESAPDKLVANPAELKEREHDNKMVEKGFDGRGVIKVNNKGTPDLAYQLFLKNLKDDSDHTNLKAALSLCDTVAAQKFLALLFNPRKKKTSIETLAKSCGIGIPQLRDIWRKAKLDQGFLNLLNEYPQTMKDVAKDARSSKEACKFCGGTGQIIDEHQTSLPSPPNVMPISGRKQKQQQNAEPMPVLISCHSCSGKGWTRKAGDKDARALMGEVLGVSGKRPPLISSTTNVFNLESVITEIEQMQPPRGGLYEATAEAVTGED